MVAPGLIDTHVHHTMDGSGIARQTLQSPAAKVLHGLSLGREDMSYGFTTCATSAAWIPSSQPSICATLWTLASSRRLGWWWPRTSSGRRLVTATYARPGLDAATV